MTWYDKGGRGVKIPGKTSDVINGWSLSAIEPHSMDSLGHQQCTKKLSPKITLHFKVLCESKATLP